MSNSVKLVALFAARAGKADQLKALLLAMAPHCRAEPGNLRWDIWQDRSDSGRIVLDELYKDLDAVAAHRETPHYKDYVAKIADFADRTAVVLEPVRVGDP